MKILWFTNNAVNLNTNTLAGGWMQCLEYHLVLDDDIQLSIATRTNGQSLRKIIQKKTTYYLIPDKRSLLQKRIDLFLNREPIDTYLKEYLKVIDEVKPDVIQVFGSEMNYGLICELVNIPVIIHIQGILHPYYYQLKKISIPFIQQWLSHSLGDYIKGNTLHNSLKVFKQRVRIEEQILSCSKYLAGRTEWDKRVSHILAPNADYFHCDEMLREVFLKANWLRKENKTINIVSTISNPIYKGHETIVATSMALKKSGIRFVWHIIGLNSQSSAYGFFYKNHMHALTEYIQLHGNLDANKIIDIFQQADMYVHPSHIENSSNSLCEAMAIGMPVIALQVGGNDSMIQQGEDGILVPDNDPYLLASVIIEVSENKDKALKIAHNAKKRALERHDPQKVIGQIRNIYTHVIDIHANSI